MVHRRRVCRAAYVIAFDEDGAEIRLIDGSILPNRDAADWLAAGGNPPVALGVASTTATGGSSARTFEV